MSEVQGTPRPRIEALDVMRGFLIIGMVLDHIYFDIIDIFELPIALFNNPVRLSLHYIGSFFFILLSGMSSSVSRRNLSRGGKLAALAAGISLVTWIASRDNFIVFGILHLLAFCMLLYGVFRRQFDRVSESTGFWLYSGLICAAILLRSVISTQLPYFWLLGFPTEEFASGDYFPLLPWVFVFLLGTKLGPAVFGGRLPEWFYRIRSRPLAFVGRYSLWIYILHQPVLVGFFMLLKDMLPV